MSITYLNMLQQLGQINQDPAVKPIKIAVGGNCSTDFLLPGLRVKLAELKFASEVINLEYNSWLAAVQQQHVQADVWLIWLSSLGATNGGTCDYSFDIEGTIQALNHLVNSNCKVIVILPERLQISVDLYAPLHKNYIETKNLLLAAMPQQVLLVDPEIIHAIMGDAAWYAPRYWSFSKLACHPNAVAHLSGYIANLIAKSIRPEVKAVVVDLDNTLWGGVIGEDGVDNLQLDVNAEGRPYIQLQFLLKQLSQQGIPLCVVSKNNLEDAQLPFMLREEMLLKLEDFVHFVANWEHKSNNIQEIASKLKLNVDSICFIDDSVHERAAVKAALPDVIVPELPENPEDRIALLLNSGIFLTPHLSKEDLERAQYYKADVQREAYQSKAVDYDQYLAGLSMELQAIRVTAANMPRVVALINKTNQFNLTNRRHTLQDLERIVAEPSSYAYCFSLSDKFGDSGIVAVLLATCSNHTMLIDTFLMSCRVLNRKVEHAIYSHFIGCAVAKGIKQVDAEYIKSPKNAQVKDLYASFGLNVIDSATEFTKYSTCNLQLLAHPINISELTTQAILE